MMSCKNGKQKNAFFPALQKMLLYIANQMCYIIKYSIHHARQIIHSTIRSSVEKERQDGRERERERRKIRREVGEGEEKDEIGRGER